MRFRMGVLAGFGAGYYLGAKAGRERYEQLNRTLRKIRRSQALDTAADKAKAVVDLGMERARDVVDSKLGNGDKPEVGADPHLRTTTDW
ncbi:MAG TPA: hypothetical protein VHF47_08820 [Acidimicrobiales bacterium]|nr:hypothetical protein [Acidimicrobiales bacterium]